MYSGYEHIFVQWTGWGMWHVYVTVLSNLPSIMNLSLVLCLALSAVLQLMLMLPTFHREHSALLAYNKSDDVCCKLDPSLLLTKVVMWCNCQTREFCDGRRERQQFSSATDSKGLWMCSVFWEHRGFTLVGGKAGNNLWVAFPWWRCGSHFHSAVKNTRCYQRTVH